MSESADKPRERITKRPRRTTARQKRLEEAPLETDQFFHKLIELTPVVIGIFDLVTGHYTYFSHGVIDLFGYAPDEIAQIDDLFSTLVHPEDIPLLREDIERTKRLKNGEIHEFECRIRRRDGEWRWILSRSMPFVRTKDGEVRQLISATFDVTKRKRAEEALKRSEEHFRSLIENSSDIICILGTDATIRYQSPSVAKILGYQPEELIGNITGFIHSDDVPQMEELCRTLQMESDVNRNFFCRFRHKNGSWRVLEGVGKTVIDESGELIGVFNARDVTERKRIEEEREKFALFVENSSEFIAICDMQLRPFFINKAGLRMVGLESADQVRNKSIEEFFFPEDREFIRGQLIPQVMREGQGEMELRFCHVKTGEALWMICSFLRLTDAQGKPTGFATVNRDITARKLAEEALHLEQQRLQLAQAVAGIGAWEWDVEADQVRWSENMGPLFGLPPGSLIGKREEFLDRVSPDDRGAIAATLRRTLEEDAPYEVRFRTIWPDGTEHWLIGKGRVLRDEHGRPLKVLGAAMDVTERMKTERAREAELDRTKGELRALAMNLLTAQEDERRRIARELHDDISQRLARLQIELDMLRHKPPADPIEVLSSLQPLAQQLAGTSDDLRRLSHRLHSGILEDLGLESGLRSLVEEFQQSFGLAATLVSDELLRTIPLPIATAVYRIAQEALRNVVKHAPGSVVNIRLSKMPQGLRLWISDTGPGFDPDAVRSRGGLGIISMQERAKLVGGTLVIRSRPGEGTKLEVNVPLEVGPRPNQPRLLIVDDDAEIRHMLRHIVEHSIGEVVGEAEHGQSAIEVAEELQPDIILLDISMPVMGGFPAARELRRRLPGARIVFVSQHAERAYAEEALRTGAFAYVLKSAAATQLPEVIRTLMNR